MKNKKNKNKDNIIGSHYIVYDTFAEEIVTIGTQKQVEIAIKKYGNKLFQHGIDVSEVNGREIFIAEIIKIGFLQINQPKKIVTSVQINDITPKILRNYFG